MSKEVRGYLEKAERALEAAEAFVNVVKTLLAL